MKNYETIKCGINISKWDVVCTGIMKFIIRATDKAV